MNCYDAMRELRSLEFFLKKMTEYAETCDAEDLAMAEHSIERNTERIRKLKAEWGF